MNKRRRSQGETGRERSGGLDKGYQPRREAKPQSRPQTGNIPSTSEGARPTSKPPSPPKEE